MTDPLHEPGDFAEAAEPFALFETWLHDATRHELNDPNAMALATVDASGHPNVRMVLLKAVDPAGHAARGFVFFTNYESAKGKELLATPYAALDFYWKSLHRQVRVRGPVTQVSAAEADAYFATRPRSAQIGAWASLQSRPLESRFALEKAVAIEAAKYLVGTVPRPPHWSGFRLTPLEIEFWHSRLSRLHERVIFKRAGASGDWSKSRLYP
ncbi:MAG: pyridoxamine 5'-phosphate oxidase [Hyphomicrobium sp.]|uniref:pyridoxamine 5'-phosphate oxidase n=1 Tax=Hyphomicrobium sp. TaxID=82 RepID=UPI001329CCF3|nr:pyridoxamine 5'-phosphate oxidase [Hyphomicrobium sp.]KAB2939994.1 MAG: pyridoxamine 5'-phosphate oxidase [Hyphomicrobium sp.]MBZ0209872.1 pyridoxamine 5'-phosphate oxidase [Hyphomicrobium sp.]